MLTLIVVQAPRTDVTVRGDALGLVIRAGRDRTRELLLQVKASGDYTLDALDQSRPFSLAKGNFLIDEMVSSRNEEGEITPSTEMDIPQA